MSGLNCRRIKTVIIIFLCVMLLLAARVGYIQIICHDDLTEAAVSQHEIAIEGLDTRGMIFDRNLQPLTGGTKQYYYIVSKKREDAAFEKIIKKIEGQQVAKETSAYHVYRTEKYNDDINNILKKEYGSYVFESQSRYADDQMACHLVGYLNQDENKGVSGLELIHQQQLKDDGDVLTVLADGAGNIIKGIAPSINADFTSEKTMQARSVITSIDRRLQYVCEKSLAKAGDGGAAVVMDTDTGEILAWASSPKFNPNDIASYLDEQGDCLIDKVCQGTYAPGSVFKIVTAIAALENNVCDETQVFECSGQITIEGVTLKCTAAEEGHGSVDMGQAMAVSCNCYFAQLGEMVGCDEIVKTAAKLGLGEKVLNNFPSEAEGNIPSEDQVWPYDITNISIGQGAILVTPLQVAKMTAIIASGGKDVTPVLYPDEKSEPANRLISESTAEKIDVMLRQVMIDGSGAGGDLWPASVHGKTGTAEATWEGKDVKNCWFTGYFSVENKNYTMTVIVERGNSGAYTAMPVFKDVVDFLSENP